MHLRWLRCSRTGLALAAMLAFAFGPVATAPAQTAEVKLFKVITAKDEVEIGLTDEELRSFGASPDIDALAKKLVDAGQITVWQYAVQRAADGTTVHAPLRRVAIFKTDTLRIEPFNPAPLKTVPPGPSR
ncbi:MAG TPA: hypothetical protein VEK82_14460 [Stellaceae bacterium]|nr:hypothetical protein [Stellaceae bacterium]